MQFASMEKAQNLNQTLAPRLPNRLLGLAKLRCLPISHIPISHSQKLQQDFAGRQSTFSTIDSASR